MDFVTQDNITILKFKALDALPHIRHAVSTRGGGVSCLEGLESLNLGTHTADDIENVRENYRRFCRVAGFDAQRVVLGNQTHSVNVRYATEADAGKGVFCERDYTDVDALVTDCRNLPLVIHSADCVPVTFADIKGRAVGNAHCGWRGTYGGLAAITLQQLQSRFGVMPQDVLCTIGPCICMSCYEVSEDLYQSFCERFGKSDALLCDDGRFFIDLAAINRQILIESGVAPQNIFVSDICTSCSTHLLYSHRAQGPSRGIFASVIELF